MTSGLEKEVAVDVIENLFQVDLISQLNLFLIVPPYGLGAERGWGLGEAVAPLPAQQA